MTSCQNLLSELRQKILSAEDNLRSTKKNLYKVHELLTSEKEKWSHSIKVEEVKIHAKEEEIKTKEEVLEGLKRDYEEALQKTRTMEAENEKLKKEIQKLNVVKQDKQNKFRLEQGNLEKELGKVQELLQDLSVSNKCTKILKEKEQKALESENENKLNGEIKELSNEFSKKIEAFNENLKEIDKATLLPKQQKVSSLQETLQNLTVECSALTIKNRELEREIQVLNKLLNEKENVTA